jgi:hypothetical protein
MCGRELAPLRGRSRCPEFLETTVVEITRKLGLVRGLHHFHIMRIIG